MLTPDRVYVQQFGTFWSFTPKQYAALVKDVLSNPSIGYDLDAYGRKLKQRPASVRGKDRNVYSVDVTVEVYSPLDWKPLDWLCQALRVAKWNV